MDSLTQGLLGAATFALIKEKEIGKQSLLIGAIAGTLPDLDILLAPLFNDIEFLSVHRSVSHSVILAIILSILLGSIFHSYYKKEQSQVKWVFAFFLAIMTHSLLDWCTTYGTKLMSPFSSHLFSTNNIHVFEPIYTGILLIGCLVALLSKSQFRRTLAVKLGLSISCAYLLWTFTSKHIAVHHFESHLAEQNIVYEDLLVSPTPMNSILWHGIVKVENGYYFGTYSHFDKREKITFQFESSYNNILELIDQNRLVNYYLNYTQDFPLIKVDEAGNVKIYAIKYGPINYFGDPEFVYPLCLNLNDLIDEHISIDYSGIKNGPVKNYKSLFKRIKGL